MNIRKATIDDVDIVIELTKELAVYEKEGDTLNIQKEVFIENILSDGAPVDCFLMESKEGDIVGMGEVFVTYGTYTSNYKLNLQDFYVREDRRGKGYGKSFMKFLAQEATRRGCNRICWGVYSWNVLARKLYDKVGTHHENVSFYSMGPKEIEALL